MGCRMASKTTLPFRIAKFEVDELKDSITQEPQRLESVRQNDSSNVRLSDSLEEERKGAAGSGRGLGVEEQGRGARRHEPDKAISVGVWRIHRG